MSPNEATQCHKLPLLENRMITSKRRLSFAAENDFIGVYKCEKFNVFQSVKPGENRQAIA
jgi:hypothetical protein